MDRRESLRTPPVSGGNPRRRRFWWSLATAVAAGVVAFLVLLHRSPDPLDSIQYRGRSYRSYLADLVLPTTNARYLEAKRAVLDLGGQGLPAIRLELERGIPWQTRVLLRWQNRLPTKVRIWLARVIRPDERLNEFQGALHGISLLGVDAASLAPLLAHRLGSGDLQMQPQIASALARIGPASVPLVIPYLTDRDLRTRALATYVLYQLGPEAAGAAGSLLASLDGADNNQRLLVAQTLGRMGGAALPAVSHLLHHPDPVMRRAALQALEELLPRARNVTPLLMTLLNDPDRDLRLRAALMVAGWWPRPVSRWRARLDAFPPGDPQHREYAAAVDALEAGKDRLVAVLHEGLRRGGEERSQAAMRLAQIGEGDAEIVACLEEVLRQDRDHHRDSSQVEALLKTAREAAVNRRSTGSEQRPDRAEAGQSPSSDPPPPADKSP